MIVVQTHYWTIFPNQISKMIKNIVLQARTKSWYFDLERNCLVEPVHIVDWNIRSARFAYTETCGFAETLCPICIREPDFDLHTTRDIHIASCPTYEWDSTNICANNIRTFIFFNLTLKLEFDVYIAWFLKESESLNNAARSNMNMNLIVGL